MKLGLCWDCWVKQRNPKRSHPIEKNGEPSTTRTYDLLLRRQLQPYYERLLSLFPSLSTIIRPKSISSGTMLGQDIKTIDIGTSLFSATSRQNLSVAQNDIRLNVLRSFLVICLKNRSKGLPIFSAPLCTLNQDQIDIINSATLGGYRG